MPYEIESLLAHREWVLRTARALAGDAALGDDVAQEVYLKAIRRPPPDARSLRGWLAAAIRHTLFDLRRGARRARRRDAAVALPETARGSPDVLAEADAHRALVDAVLRLAEPYRETILLRYFRGLGPPAIARAQRVPVDTVKTRLRRGLVLLRENLSAREGGLGAFILALFGSGRRPPGNGPGGAAAGGALMGLKTKAVLATLAVLLLAGGGYLARGPGGGSPAPVREGALPVKPAPGGETGALPAPTPAAASGAGATGGEAGPRAAGRATGACHGRLTLPDGRPAAHLAVWLSGTPSRHVSTDADGKFRIEDEWVDQSGRLLWVGDAEGDEREGVVSVGTVPLRVGEDVEHDAVLPGGVRVPVEIRSGTDGAGVPGVTVYLEPPAPSDLTAWARTGADGTARLGPVPPGPYHVRIRQRGYTPVSTRFVVDAAAPSPLRIRLDPAEPLRLEVSPPPDERCTINLSLLPEKGSANDRGFSYVGRLETDGTFTTDAPPPGRYRVFVEVYGLLRRSDLELEVRPRSPVAIRIERAPGVAIEGRLVTSDGRPVRATVMIGDRKAVADEAGRFRITAVPPGRRSVTVSFAGTAFSLFLPLVDVPETGLAGYEIRIPKGGRVRGKILGADRPGLIGISVFVPAEDGSLQLRGMIQPSVSGSFLADHLRPGRTLLRLAMIDPAAGWAPPREVEIAEGESEDVEIRLRPNPPVELLLTDAAGAAVTGPVEVVSVPLGELGGTIHRATLTADATGRVTAHVLSPGRQRLSVSGGRGRAAAKTVEIREADNPEIELRLPE